MKKHVFVLVLGLFITLGASSGYALFRECDAPAVPGGWTITRVGCEPPTGQQGNQECGMCRDIRDPTHGYPVNCSPSLNVCSTCTSFVRTFPQQVRSANCTLTAGVDCSCGLQGTERFFDNGVVVTINVCRNGTGC